MSRVPFYYRWLVRFFPSHFRREFGRDMEQFYADRLREARSGGEPGGPLSQWSHAAFDSARNGIRERAAALRGSSAPAYPASRSRPRSPSDPGRRGAWRSILTHVFADTRHSLRLMAKKPFFALSGVVTLGLGIGTTTMMLSVVDTVLLKPLPYPDSEQLVAVFRIDPEVTGPNPSVTNIANLYAVPYEVFGDWRDMSPVFESAGAYYRTSVALTGGDRAERLTGAVVTSGVFEALDIPAALGRTFIPADDEVGAPGVVALSHGLWQDQFGGDSTVLGRQLSLSGRQYTVVGVMPEDFRFPSTTTQLWMTLSDERKTSPVRNAGYLQVIARIRSGVSLEQAQREEDAVARRIGEAHPAEVEHGIGLFSYKELVLGSTGPGLLILLGAVGLVLLIACANIANLLLVRATERRRELGIRQALGAGRYRLMAQHLNESVVLSLVGGVAGLIFAVAVRGPFIAAVPGGVPRSGEIAVDYRVFVIAAAISLLTGLLAGLLPALRAGRSAVVDVLQDGGRGFVGGKKRNRTNTALVVSEVSLAFALLAVAGLLVKSYVRLSGVERGFDAEGVVVMPVTLPAPYRQEPADAYRFFEELGDRLAAVPGVRQVGGASQMPFVGGMSFPPTSIETAEGVVEDIHHFSVVTPEYFGVMHIPTVAGRLFTSGDRFSTDPVIVVNEAMARKYWPNENPVGRHVRRDVAGDSIWRTVIGVVGDVRWNLNQDALSDYYVPYAQDALFFHTMVLKTSIDPTAIIPAAREALWAIDRDIPARAWVLEDLITDSASVAGPRFGIYVLGSLSALAAVLAVLGVYGVLAYTVEQRAGEIGIRIALGAGTRDVVGNVLRSGGLMAGLGVAIGLGIAVAVSRITSAMLYEVSPTDPATLAAVALVVAGAALAASYIPARRATKVDPVEAVRME
jgi:putative ABC transport system permease protein